MLTRKIGTESLFSASRLALLCLLLVLGGCSSGRQQTSRYSQSHDSAPEQHIEVSQIKDAVPRAEPVVPAVHHYQAAGESSPVRVDMATAPVVFTDTPAEEIFKIS